MHFEQDGIGMPYSEPPPVFEQEDFELHGGSYSDQHDRFTDFDRRHYDLEHHDDIDPNLQHDSDVVVPSDDNVFEDVHPVDTNGPPGFAETHQHLVNKGVTNSSTFLRAPPVSQTGRTGNVNQSLTDDVDHTLPEHETSQQRPYNDCNEQTSSAPCPRGLPQKLDIHGHEQVNTTTPKLLWKFPAHNIQMYQRSSDRGFSLGAATTTVSANSQPLWSASHPTKQRTRPAVEVQPQIRDTASDARTELPGEPTSAEWDEDVSKGLAKLRKKEQATLAQHNLERADLTSQLQHTAYVNQELQTQGERLQHENQGLCVSLQQQQARLASLGAKANSFKTFLHGLGADIATLKQDAGTRQQKSEELVRELDATKSTQTALLEKSAELRDEALKLAQEAHGELTEMTHHATQLKKQLNEKCRMLGEEKNARLQLQSQLRPSSSEDISRLLKSQTDAVLDKLFEIHAEIEENGADGLTQMLEKLLAATQGLNSQQVTTIEDIASIKEIVDTMSEGVLTHTSMGEPKSDHDLPSTPHLHEALASLKTDLCRHQELMVQATVDQESIARLQQQLHDSSRKIADQTSALEESRASYDDLKERHSFLQGQADTTARTVAKHDAEMERMITEKAHVQAQANVTEQTRADLATKTNEAKTLGDTNAALRAEVESLQQALTAARLESRAIPDQEDFARKLDAAVKAAKEETSRIANDLHVQDKIRNGNDLKKITSARDELSEQITHLQTKLRSAKDEAEVSAVDQQSIFKLQKLADDRELEIQSLRVRLDELTRSVASTRDAEEKYDSLNAQYTAQVRQLDDIVQHRDRLTQQLASVTTELSDCKKAVQTAERRAEHIKSQAQHEVSNEKDKCQKRVDALQQHLETVQAEKQAQEKQAREFQNMLETNWKEHEEQQKEKVARLMNKIAELEAEKSHAVADYEAQRAGLSYKATASLARQSRPSLHSQNGWVHEGTGGKTLLPEQALHIEDAGFAAPVDMVPETQLQTDWSGNSASQHAHLSPSVEGTQHASYTYANHRGSNIFRGSSQGDAEDAEGTQDLVDRLTRPDARTSAFPGVDMPTFGEFNAQQDFVIHQDDSAANDDRLQTGGSQGARSTIGEDYAFTKRMPPPNSAMKRAQPRSVLQRGDNGGPFPILPPQQSSRYMTPEPRAATPEDHNNTTMHARSSSPDFVVNSTKGLTLYQGVGKRNSGANMEGHRPNPQAKRKAEAQVVPGYELQRKKLMVEEPSRGRWGLRSLSQPMVRTLEESGLQSELDANQSRTRALAGHATRSTRGAAKKLNKGERMSARFAKELNG
ncbi:hypothetical protein Slin15195_G005900 [Septoria linicola]|uniref:Uncharacterized protein n=1 Tax=Septoria linicola TaxID=215465 RepID=A0A9Q9AJV7_9PEZI|nr:hypothetical protein Slin14017_G005930 [Septoria linicola]USW47271.1 hypothetical protein Slin15195_G005900 [Septoria linicola]